ncbi:hypothetical protein SLS62_005020 [Diatrype stigma]|uniref:lytic cellulose monooxygenase (C4-dehydrogenating) n=1 Tax=Diatrype stigma TaxID=117547 RepID=A0AAN9UVP5_9PEZI
MMESLLYIHAGDDAQGHPDYIDTLSDDIVVRMALALTFVAWAFLVRLIRAHGGLANYTVGETWYRGYDPDEPKEEQVGQDWMVQRVWDSIDPIFFVNESGLACNDPGTPPSSYIPIEAGQDLTAVYWYWLHPVGPMSVWLAECDGPCEDADVNQLDFFKIWEAGLLDGTLEEGMWYQKQFQNWDGTPDLWPVTIPSTIKPGLYVIRHEIMSIHVANSITTSKSPVCTSKRLTLDSQILNSTQSVPI